MKSNWCAPHQHDESGAPLTRDLNHSRQQVHRYSQSRGSLVPTLRRRGSRSSTLHKPFVREPARNVSRSLPPERRETRGLGYTGFNIGWPITCGGRERQPGKEYRSVYLSADPTIPSLKGLRCLQMMLALR